MKQNNTDSSTGFQTEVKEGGTAYIGIHFHSLLSNLFRTPTTNEYKTKISDAINQQIEKRLKDSLHNRVYIPSDKDEDPKQVEPYWDIEVRAAFKSKSRLSNNEDIITIFDRSDVEGRLLILGKPGVGKTTLLLKLAQVLISRAKEGLSKRIPILLSLPSWQDNYQSIADWIVAELSSDKYGVPRNIAKQWLKDGEIIPLLDGLDELTAERQERCVQKLNDFLQPGNWHYPLVVCSRTEEYQLYPTQLALNTSIEILSFTQEKIQDYLKRTDNEELWNSIKDDSQLIELVKIPFLLVVTVLSYQEILISDWQSLKSLEERRSYLLSAYINARLKQKTHSQYPDQVRIECCKRWLAWLSSKLSEKSQTDFYIETMQPSLLDNKSKIQQWSYELIIRLIIGIVGLTEGLILGLTYLAISNVLKITYDQWIIGVIFGSISGILLISKPQNYIKIKSLEKLKISLEGKKKILILLGTLGIAYGIIGCIIGIIFGEGFNLSQPVLWVAVSFLISLTSGLLLGITMSFCYEPSNIIKILPNQGIRKSIQNTIVLSFISYLALIAIGLAIATFAKKSIDTTNLSIIFDELIIFSITVWLPLSMFGGGLAAIQHFTLRLLLYCNGYIPWNYAHFLEYAAKRLLLQRVGGSYRFMHKLLQDYLAANYRLKQDNSSHL